MDTAITRVEVDHGEATSASYDRLIRREMRLTKSWWSRAAIVAYIVLAIGLPLELTNSLWLSLLTSGAVYGIGALGINVLNGYAGHASLGHAFFVSVGAFVAIQTGSTWGWPLPLWLIAAAVVGGALGVLLVPLAMRLRGIYEIILTLGLVYIGTYIFTNWRGLTGGSTGVPAQLKMNLGFIDFSQMIIGNEMYTYEQGVLMLSLLLVGLCVLLVHNVMRSRTGRAIVASRDGALAAEVVGASPIRTRLTTYSLSSGLAALCGAMLAAQLRYVNENQFNLQLSVQFIVIMIVGGAATTWGPVIGALAVSALPIYITTYASSIPFVKQPTDGTSGFGIMPGQLSLVAYGLLLAVFLVLQPSGLVGLAKSGVVLGRRAVRLGRPRTATEG